MFVKLSERVVKLSPSMTLAIDAKAKEMASQGVDVIGFGAGEPDFDTPQHIQDAGIEAIQKGFTRYTATAGIADLKQAVCTKLQEDNGLTYQPNQILVSTGAKHSLFNAIMSICNEGDEVIIPQPYWVSYPEMVLVADALPVYVDCKEENGFKMTVEDLKAAITKKTKAMFLNSPSNPTGAIYTKEDLEGIAALAVEHDFYIISDEIYEKLIYDDNKFVSIAQLGEEIKKRTILINGMSKAYAMTGWRIGYAAAEPELISAMARLQGHSTSNATSFCQTASVAALLGDQEPIAKMVVEFEKRRNYMVKTINSIPGLSCLKPGGAFYVMANVSELYGKEIGGVEINDSITLAQVLLEQIHVAVVPGAAFGADDFVRLSYATSMANIETGLRRIADFLKDI